MHVNKQTVNSLHFFLALNEVLELSAAHKYKNCSGPMSPVSSSINSLTTKGAA